MAPRSYLFVPGDSPRKIEKSVGSGADAVILDLEDSVAPPAKAAARDTVAEALGAGGEIARYVRVNALDTGLTQQDVEAIAPAGPDGWVLPKCEGAADVQTLVEMIAAAGGGEAPVVAIATETPRAVLSLMSTDWTHARLAGLAWGAEDLSAELGAGSKRLPDGTYRPAFGLARDTMLFAAKAARAQAIDGPFPDFRDEAGLIAEAEAALAVGFTGKLAIHPAQVAPINRVFTPSDAQADWARRVVAAMEDAGGGVASLDGQMIDQPHLKLARSILARAGQA